MKNVAETVNSHKCVLGTTRIIDRMENGCLRGVDVPTTYVPNVLAVAERNETEMLVSP